MAYKFDELLHPLYVEILTETFKLNKRNQFVYLVIQTPFKVVFDQNTGGIKYKTFDSSVC